MSEHPAVAYLRNAHERAGELASRMNTAWWPSVALETRAHAQERPVLPMSDEDGKRLVAWFDLTAPEAMLARIQADQAVMALHEPTWPTGEPEYDHHHETVIGEHGRTRYVEVRDDEPVPPYWCACCSTPAPCPTLLALAAGWGWEAGA